MQVSMGDETFIETIVEKKGFLLSQTTAVGTGTEAIHEVPVLRDSSCYLEEKVNIGRWGRLGIKHIIQLVLGET